MFVHVSFLPAACPTQPTVSNHCREKQQIVTHQFHSFYDKWKLFKSEVLMWIVSLNVVHMKIASHIRPCIFDTNNNTYRLMCYSCVCCVNALTATLWVGWQKSPVACNNICSSNPQVVTQETFLAPKHTGIDFFTSIQTVTVTSLPSSAILTELHGYLFTLKSSSS